MSKHMQLTVMVKSCYKNDLENSYPNLGQYLNQTDKDPAGRNPSLYELAGLTDQLLYRADGTRLREAMLPYKDDLKNTYNDIQNHIAEWKLAQADKLLFHLEDIFDEIEFKLA